MPNGGPGGNRDVMRAGECLFNRDTRLADGLQALPWIFLQAAAEQFADARRQ